MTETKVVIDFANGESAIKWCSTPEEAAAFKRGAILMTEYYRKFGPIPFTVTLSKISLIEALVIGSDE